MYVSMYVRMYVTMYVCNYVCMCDVSLCVCVEGMDPLLNACMDAWLCGCLYAYTMLLVSYVVLRYIELQTVAVAA